jgi:threonine synthase
VRSAFVGLRCTRCGAEFDPEPMFEGCPKCAVGEWAANLAAVYDVGLARNAWSSLVGRGVWRYTPVLPVRDPRSRTTLGEGDTPLVDVPGLGGVRWLWLKNESANPTWSYKDRMCSVAVSVAREMGARTIGVSSTGNHGASAAAYAARAGLDYVALTKDDVGDPTLAFLQIFGGLVLKTSRRGRWELLRYGVHELGWHSVSTYTSAPTGNPYGVEGYKTLAFEIVAQLGHVPNAVVVPTCYGEGLSGIWAGFQQLVELGQTDSTPRMVAAEPAGGAPLSRTLAAGLDHVVSVPAYSTVAKSIGASVANDRSLLALRASCGTSIPVTDDQILRAQQELGRRGIFGEPAGVAGVAALALLPESLSGFEPGRDEVVVILTAGGLRDHHASRERLAPVATIEATPAALLDALDKRAARPNTPSSTA